MKNELEPGCLAVIIQSVLGQSVGKIVQCVRQQGEHSLYGLIWQVRSKDELMSEYGGLGNLVDVPAAWLKKINPDDLNKTTTKDKELQSE